MTDLEKTDNFPAYSLETAAHFNRLSLRKGVSLVGVSRNPLDLDVFFLTVSYFITKGATECNLARDEFYVRLEDFLKRWADWLKTTPEEVIEAMRACGCVAIYEETAKVAIAIAPDAEGPERVAQEWFALDTERVKRRARLRAQLQERNRTINAPKLPQPDPELDPKVMEEAIRMAHVAKDKGEVPVGAVIVVDGNIVAAAGNETITRHDPTAHAEILAIRKAAAALGNERLTGATLYVTLEPCPMCAAAIAHARISRVVWGADDPNCGGMRSALDVAAKAHMNHRAVHTPSVKRAECEAVLKDFFQGKRRAQKAK
ncbi:MAG: tRNA adenosine(34) deaminase TadA [Sutterellaceae bacterium]|nr:tRNA adenosine(34) deaminase TadA [Sutterellaceae bacterium]